MYFILFILDNNNPGPDKYDIKPLISGNGYNYVSKFKSALPKTITGKPRDNSLSNASNFYILIWLLDQDHIEPFQNLEFISQSLLNFILFIYD
jgi:hypothetical protein